MQFVRQVILYVTFTSLLFLFIGLFKPWMMVWWEDVQNRRKVIKIYGSIAIFSYGAYWLLKYL
jgi:hypothetical protein